MPFECPKETEIAPYSELFSFDFTTNMNGTNTQNINYTANKIPFFTNLFKYDILEINKGINNPVSKHWPVIETWKTINTTKIKKIFGKKFPIKQFLYKPTQTVNEIFTSFQKPKLTFYTIPTFKFQMNSNFKIVGSLSNNFTLSVEGKGGCLLKDTTAKLIDDYYNDGKQILQMSNSTDRTNRIINMVANPKFLAYVSATVILTYLLRDGLSAEFSVLKASSKINWTLNSFYIEFGDLKIQIPKFQIELDFPDLLKDPITGQEHPVTVSADPGAGLTARVQLISIPNGNFYGLMITSLQNTLNLAKSATGSDYDANYVKELEDILSQLQNVNDTVTQWLQKYLGISYTITFSFLFCPAGISNVPPTPFYLLVEIDLQVNPYKIINELFDAAEVIEKTMIDFENKFWDDMKSIKNTGFAHPLENMLKGSLNRLNKELLSATEKAQKEMNNKYVNKIYSPVYLVSIPIEPPP